MKNLQDLYDAYIETRPSTGKIRTATAMMIHACKALDLSSQEEITIDYFESIPNALESFFFAHTLKATIDKTILAEMIGRLGPKKNVKKLLDRLLTDQNENVRQFALHSLEFYGIQHPQTILPYLERFRKSTEPEMRTTAAMLVGRLQCAGQSEWALGQIMKWYKQDDLLFVGEVLSRMIQMRKQKKCEKTAMNLPEVYVWINKNCSRIAGEVIKK
ncbi:MAG: HEAT repeat domain-containing protein [Calditrichales bacterium]|nr:MAG: HEAT repeat domain-containing protein [Calditrichales bacterium]